MLSLTRRSVCIYCTVLVELPTAAAVICNNAYQIISSLLPTLDEVITFI